MNEELIQKYDESFAKMKKLGVFSVLPSYDVKGCDLYLYGLNFFNLKYDEFAQHLNDFDSHILEMISGIMFLVLRADDNNQIYAPGFHCSDDKRSLILEDIENEFVVSLHNNAETVYMAPIILSRLFDVIWVRKGIKQRDVYEAGRKAFKYYNIFLDELLDADNLYVARNIFSRMHELAFSLGRQFEGLSEYLDKLLSFMEKPVSSENLFFMFSIWQKIAQINWGNKKAEILNQLVNVIEGYILHNEENLSWQKSCSDLLCKIYFCLKDYNQQQAILEWIAQKYIDEAGRRDSPMVKIHFLSQAVDMYKRIYKNPHKDKVLELYKEIQQLQSEKDVLIQKIVHKTDITEKVKELLEKFDDKDFTTCIYGLWLNKFQLPNEEQIKKEVEKAPKSALIDTITTSYQNHLGQTVYVDKGDFHEYQHKQLFRQILLQMRIRPLLTLMNEHFFYNESSIRELFSLNPFVPPEYELLYTKGIYYFLKGMFIEAASILVPLIENSLRYILSEKYPAIYKKDSSEIFANRIEIKQLIDLIREEKLLDETLLFHLEDLIVDPRNNIRNYIAHGLYPQQYFFSDDVVMLLFIIFVLAVDSVFGQSLPDTTPHSTSDQTQAE